MDRSDHLWDMPFKSALEVLLESISLSQWSERVKLLLWCFILSFFIVYGVDGVFCPLSEC